MKRTVAILMVFLTLLLSACSGPPSFQESTAQLSAWMTENGLDETLSQVTFFYGNVGTNLYYDGKPLSKQISGTYFDGSWGGGFNGFGKHFGFSDNWVRSEDSSQADYYVSFYTDVELDGMVLPLGLSFGKDFTSVATALGAGNLSPNSFRADLDSETDMTVITQGNASLLFCNYTNSQNGNSNHPLHLVLRETYQSQLYENPTRTVTRTLSLQFDSSDYQLRRIQVNIHSNYPLD